MKTFVRVKGLNNIFNIKNTTEYDPTSIKSTASSTVDEKTVAFIESVEADKNKTIEGHTISGAGEVYIWTQKKIYAMPTTGESVVTQTVTASLESSVGHIDDGDTFEAGSTLTEVLQQIFTGDIYGYVGDWETNVVYTFSQGLQLQVSVDSGTTWSTIQNDADVITGSLVKITVTPTITASPASGSTLDLKMYENNTTGVLKYGYKETTSGTTQTGDFTKSNCVTNTGTVASSSGGSQFINTTGSLSGLAYQSGVGQEKTISTSGDHTATLDIFYQCDNRVNTSVSVYAVSKEGNISTTDATRFKTVSSGGIVKTENGEKLFDPIVLHSGLQYFYKWGASASDVSAITTAISGVQKWTESTATTAGLTNFKGTGKVGTSIINENTLTALNGYIVLLIPSTSTPAVTDSLNNIAQLSDFTLIDNTSTDILGHTYCLYKFPYDAEAGALYKNLTAN